MYRHRTFNGALVYGALLCCQSCDSPAITSVLTGPSESRAASAPAVASPDVVVLNMLWRVPRPVGSATDYMTTHVAHERDLFGSDKASLVFYVPTSPLSGTDTLYRLFGLNVGFNDHMESLLKNESGYALDAVPGFPWTSSGAASGLVQLIRTYKSWDHALTYDGEGLTGYTGREPLGLYGYRRYGTAATDLLSLTAGGVTVKSNRVTGCALWSWVWSGTEFVNVRDYGREIQGAFVVDPGIAPGNPTEAGSRYSDPAEYPFAFRRQGSPCLQAANTSTIVQSTRAVPLEWTPEAFGGDTTHPVIWANTQVGKDIQLNFNNMGPVAKYITVFTVPVAYPRASVEIPAVYLTANLSRFFLFDAKSQQLSQLTDAGPATRGTVPPSGFGGLIVADGSGGLAFGLYGVTSDSGGSVTRIGAGFQYLLSLVPGESPYGPTSRSTSKINALNHGGLTAGTNRFNTYLMSGTLTSVESYMRQLYLIGAR